MVSSGHEDVLCIELYFMIPGVTELSPLKTKMLHGCSNVRLEPLHKH